MQESELSRGNGVKRGGELIDMRLCSMRTGCYFLRTLISDFFFVNLLYWGVIT